MSEPHGACLPASCPTQPLGITSGGRGLFGVVGHSCHSESREAGPKDPVSPLASCPGPVLLPRRVLPVSIIGHPGHLSP